MAEIYEGIVSSWDKKADGSPLIIGKGDRQGEPYYKVSFKVGGEYVNLMDFDGVTRGAKGDYRVEYYQKFAPNGEPELYNGKPQYALVDIQPLGTAPAPQRANAAPPAAQSGATAESPSDRQKSIELQTIIKAWGEVKAGSAIDPIGFAAEVKAVWQGVFGEDTNEFDAMVTAAKDKLMDDVADPDDDIPFG